MNSNRTYNKWPEQNWASQIYNISLPWISGTEVSRFYCFIDLWQIIYQIMKLQNFDMKRAHGQHNVLAISSQTSVFVVRYQISKKQSCVITKDQKISYLKHWMSQRENIRLDWNCQNILIIIRSFQFGISQFHFLIYALPVFNNMFNRPYLRTAQPRATNTLYLWVRVLLWTFTAPLIRILN